MLHSKLCFPKANTQENWVECFILNTKDKLSKFDPKSDLRIFLGHSFVFKAYRVYNRKTQTVEKTIHISFKERKKDVD